MPRPKPLVPRNKQMLVKVTREEWERAHKVARKLETTVSEIVRRTFRFLHDKSTKKAA